MFKKYNFNCVYFEILYNDERLTDSYNKHIKNNFLKKINYRI